MKRVGVTGAGGFIGSAVTKVLVEQGWTVGHLDLPVHDVRVIGPHDFIHLNLNAVIHLAGVLGTHELFDTVDLAIDSNVRGTAKVLEAAKLADIPYVGITMPAVFPSIYAATKLAATGLERAFHHTYGLPVSRVRAFNAYGPGQKHGPGHPQKIVPTFAVEAWANRPIPIWGDGEQTVDLVHAGDLARMLVDALDHGDDVTFDGGTGKALTVNEVADFVIEVTGSTAGKRYLPMRRGEVPTQIVATGEGWNRLDWRPQLDMERLAETIEAYR